MYLPKKNMTDFHAQGFSRPSWVRPMTEVGVKKRAGGLTLNLPGKSDTGPTTKFDVAELSLCASLVTMGLALALSRAWPKTYYYGDSPMVIMSVRANNSTGVAIPEPVVLVVAVTSSKEVTDINWHTDTESRTDAA